MGLFENLPFTNFENLNLDMILEDIKVMKTNEENLNDRVTVIESGYDVINESIQNIQGDITNIYNQLGEIDITDLEHRVDVVEERCTTLNNNINNVLNRVVADEENIETNTTNITTNNDSSIARDNALAARIASLERAHLHDIYNYYSEGNILLFGSDLRNLPDSCKQGGFPIGYGNPTNRHLYVGQTKTRAWKLTANGFQPDTSSTDGYDYYQMGQFPASLGVADYVTVTFAVSTGGDATPSAWYKHTFQASNEQWEIASGCIVKFMQHTDDVNSDIYTVAFLGTPANWANVVDSTHYIPYIFVEWGSGSVSTEATDKCKFDIKDRLPFMDITAPEYVPTVERVTSSKRFDTTASWVDAQGFTHNVTVPVTLSIERRSISSKVYNFNVIFMFDWTNNVDMILNLNAFEISFNQALTYETDTDDLFYNIEVLNSHVKRNTSNDYSGYLYNIRDNAYFAFSFAYGTASSSKHKCFMHLVSSGLSGSVGSSSATTFECSFTGMVR